MGRLAKIAAFAAAGLVTGACEQSREAFAGRVEGFQDILTPYRQAIRCCDLRFDPVKLRVETRWGSVYLILDQS